MTTFSRFLRDDRGAVTIDWVALTAGILLLGIAVVYAIFNGGVNPLTAGILLLGIAVVYAIFNGGVNPLISSVNSALSTSVSVSTGPVPNPNSN